MSTTVPGPVIPLASAAPEPPPYTPNPAAMSVPAMAEIGVSGLRHVGGQVHEEFLRDLRGPKGMQTIREMIDNSPIIGAVLWVYESLLRNLTWRVEPPAALAKDTQAQAVAAFVEECLVDMETDWEDALSEILTMLPFGWSACEPVYKLRHGMDGQAPETRSKFKDGRVGLRKMPLRAQESLWEWNITDAGDVKGFTQQVLWGSYGGQRYIPREKFFHFRTRSVKNNPEGRSILRTAYTDWYAIKHHERMEAIGHERDATGVPVIGVPPEVMDTSSQDAGILARRNEAKRLGRHLRTNEESCVLLPRQFDADRNPLWTVELLKSPGTRQFDANSIIERRQRNIFLATNTDFLLLGHEQAGTRSLSEEKREIFAAAVNAIADRIAGVFNREVFPQLVALNGFPPELTPCMVPSSVQRTPTIQEVAEAVPQLAGAGMTFFPDEELENDLRAMLHLRAKKQEL